MAATALPVNVVSSCCVFECKASAGIITAIRGTSSSLGVDPISSNLGVSTTSSLVPAHVGYTTAVKCPAEEADLSVSGAR